MTSAIVPPAPGLSCESCSAPIPSVYYMAGDRVLCERCHAELLVNPDPGSGTRRFAKAAVFGIAAAVGGSALWYGFRALTDHEAGVIAIVVGLMVGGAVRKGSGGRGGWRYQTLAIALTYISIVSTYIPEIFGQLKQSAATQESQPASPAPSAAAGAQPAPAPAPDAPPTAGRALLALVVVAALLLALAMAAPFLAGAENLIGLVIIGIALYEAWKLNVRVNTEVTGPFRLDEGPAVPSPPTPPQ